MCSKISLEPSSIHSFRVVTVSANECVPPYQGVGAGCTTRARSCGQVDVLHQTVIDETRGRQFRPPTAEIRRMPCSSRRCSIGAVSSSPGQVIGSDPRSLT